MKKSLLAEALVKYIAGIILLMVLLFLPAGSLSWKNGWLFMGLLFVPMLIAGLLMYFKAPGLLRSRLNAKETQSAQKDVINYSGLMFLAAFIVAGLNYRFNWITFPRPVVIVGCVIFLLSYLMFGEVLRENEYLSRTIEFVIMLAYIPIIMKRTVNEEEFLEKELEGYAEYKKKIKYRIIPFIW